MKNDGYILFSNTLYLSDINFVEGLTTNSYDKSKDNCDILKAIIADYYSLVYDNDFSYLISLLENKELDKFVLNISEMDDEYLKMKQYILNYYE